MNVILFDGVCNLCNSTVNFIIDRDKNSRFRFASLQSDFGKKQIERFSLNSQYLDTIVLIEGEKVYVRAIAVLRILKQLGGIYSLTSVFMAIPSPILNFFYHIVAKYRYAWFGKRDTCRAPEEWTKDKFIE